MADFVEICNVCARKAIIEAAKRIINSDKVCHSYSDFNFGVTFFGTQCSSIVILVHFLISFFAVYGLYLLNLIWNNFYSRPMDY